MNKKRLYESIMKDVSKIVKKHLNESDDFSQYTSDTRIDDIIDKFFDYAYENDFHIYDLSDIMYVAKKLIAKHELTFDEFEFLQNYVRSKSNLENFIYLVDIDDPDLQ